MNDQTKLPVANDAGNEEPRLPIWRARQAMTVERYPSGYLHGKLLRGLKVPGISLGLCAYKPKSRVERHAHKHARLVFTLQGGFSEKYEKKSRESDPLTAVFRPPGELHEEWFHGQGGLCLSADLEPQWMKRIRDYGVVLDDSAEFRDGTISLLGSKLRHELENPDRVSALVIEGILFEVLAAAVRLNTNDSHLRAPRWLLTVRDLLHARFADRLDLNFLARAANVHPVHVARGFRKMYGCSVGSYVRQLRINFACREIVSAKNSLGDIAFAAGFADQSHLTRTFRRQMGITPAKYRVVLGRRLRPFQEGSLMQDARKFRIWNPVR